LGNTAAGALDSGIDSAINDHIDAAELPIETINAIRRRQGLDPLPAADSHFPTFAAKDIADKNSYAYKIGYGGGLAGQAILTRGRLGVPGLIRMGAKMLPGLSGGRGLSPVIRFAARGLTGDLGGYAGRAAGRGLAGRLTRNVKLPDRGLNAGLNTDAKTAAEKQVSQPPKTEAPKRDYFSDVFGSMGSGFAPQPALAGAGAMGAGPRNSFNTAGPRKTPAPLTDPNTGADKDWAGVFDDHLHTDPAEERRTGKGAQQSNLLPQDFRPMQTKEDKISRKTQDKIGNFEEAADGERVFDRYANPKYEETQKQSHFDALNDKKEGGLSAVGLKEGRFGDELKEPLHQIAQKNYYEKFINPTEYLDFNRVSEKERAAAGATHPYSPSTHLIFYTDEKNLGRGTDGEFMLTPNKKLLGIIPREEMIFYREHGEPINRQDDVKNIVRHILAGNPDVDRPAPPATHEGLKWREGRTAREIFPDILDRATRHLLDPELGESYFNNTWWQNAAFLDSAEFGELSLWPDYKRFSQMVDEFAHNADPGNEEQARLLRALRGEQMRLWRRLRLK